MSNVGDMPGVAVLPPGAGIGRTGKVPLPPPVRPSVATDLLASTLDAEVRRLGLPPLHRITDRSRAPRYSTAGVEVLHCTWTDGSATRVLWKWATPIAPGSRGSARGIGYEALVYELVLRGRGLGVPGYFGRASGIVDDEDWLFIQLIEGGVLIWQAVGDVHLRNAASWLGRFHRGTDGRDDAAHPTHLLRYTPDYYRHWVRETVRFANGQPSWLAPLARRLEDALPAILAGPTCVIHGEFYPNNILLQQRRVVPVDWESAAVAAGEIDLVSLTENWGEEQTAACTVAYKAARWLGAEPSGLGERLDAARAYFQCRWLGARPDWAHNGRRLTLLREAGERLGLL